MNKLWKISTFEEIQHFCLNIFLLTGTQATFKLTVNVPKDRVALSNMPVESENVVGNAKRVSFESSPKMSTYLVALVVGELEYLESETSSGMFRLYVVFSSFFGHFSCYILKFLFLFQVTKCVFIVRVVKLSKENFLWILLPES